MLIRNLRRNLAFFSRDKQQSSKPDTTADKTGSAAQKQPTVSSTL